MITKVWLENYGPFEKAEFHLTPLTVIVGPNASGKSTLLQLLSALTGKRMQDGGNLERRRRRGAPEDSVAIGYDRSDGQGASLHQGNFTDGTDGGFIFLDDADVADRSIFLDLQPRRLREPSYLDTVAPLIHSDGYGLATALAYLKLNEEATFQAVLEQTRRIVPNFQSVRFRRTQVAAGNPEAQVYGDELFFDMNGAPNLPPDLVSDGTLLTLGILTAAFQHSTLGESPSNLILLLDELEHGLHPRALHELVSQLRAIAENNNLQVLATSHSPYLLDALRPEEVRLTGLLENGNATIRNLTDHPDFERWKDEMSPGEFWSHVGEDWIR